MSVSLVAVAAIATSLLLTRSRPDKDTLVRMAGGQASTQQPLDAIRAAGL